MTVVPTFVEPGVAQSDLPRIERFLSGRPELRKAPNWRALERMAAGADVVLFITEYPSLGYMMERVSDFRMRFLGAVGLLRGITEDAPVLSSLDGWEQTVRLRRSVFELDRLLEKLASQAVLRSLGFEMASQASLPNLVREAFRIGCEAKPPILSVRELVHAVGCNRTTLWRVWRGAFCSERLPLQSFLSWILLLRAAEAMALGRSASGTAARFSTTSDRLRRWGPRLTGVEIAAVARHPWIWAKEFRKLVLESVNSKFLPLQRNAVN